MEPASGLSISLHPLVIMNVSEHFTRQRACQPPGTPVRVFGCLLGTLSGRNVDICNSFELKVGSGEHGVHVIDGDFLKTRLDQYLKVFKTYELLGWYSTARDLQDSDLTMHRQMSEITESPMYLVLDPQPGPMVQDLPITIYETEMHIVNDNPTMQLAKASYKIDSVDSERISVDHVANISSTGDGPESGALVTHLGGQQSAIKMLSDRIKVLQAYLAATRDGTIPVDHAALRQIKSLCSSLPTVSPTSRFTEDFLGDYNDTLLVTYLASITQSTGTINDVVDKFHVAYDKHQRRRGIF